MSALPETGFLRLPQIIGDKTAEPPIPPIIPVSKATWWNGVKSGKYPKSVKLGQRITAWKVEDIRDLIETMGTNDENHEDNKQNQRAIKNPLINGN